MENSDLIRPKLNPGKCIFNRHKINGFGGKLIISYSIPPSPHLFNVYEEIYVYRYIKPGLFCGF